VNKRVDAIADARAWRDQPTRQQHFAKRTRIEVETRLRFAQDGEVGDATEFCHDERPTDLTSEVRHARTRPNNDAAPASPGRVNSSLETHSILEHDFGDLVTRANRVDDFESLHNLAEAGVVAVEVRGVLAAVAHEELRTTRIATGVRHREDAAIVTLVAAAHFALDLVARTTGAGALRAAALNHKVRDHAVERESVVEALRGEITEVLHGVWGVGVVELDVHVALRGLDDGFRHRAKSLPEPPAARIGHTAYMRPSPPAGAFLRSVPRSVLRVMAWGVLMLGVLGAFTTVRPARADETEAFFKKGTIPVIELKFDEASVGSLRNDPRTYARVLIVVDGKELTNAAGAKLKGAAGSFQSFDERPGFTINLGKFDGKSRLHGMRKFHLNNAVQDPTLLSEWLASSILRDADVPATLVSHARLKVNERDLGVYVLKESFDEDFLRRNFRNATGNLYDGGFCADVDSDLERDEGKDVGKDVGENGETRADLRALADACNDPDMKSRWKKLEQLVDIPAFIRFMAIEAMMSHWDGYCYNSNNYRLYFEPAKRARFIPHGMDQCFQDPGMSILDMPRALVAASVMKNPEWRSAYRREIVRLLPEFDPQRLMKRLEPVQKRLQEALRAYSNDAADSQANEARALADRLGARAQNLLEQRSAPEPKPLVFKLGTAVAVRGFHGMSEVEDANVEEVDENGAQWYRVTAGPSGRCIAGFRRGVLLERGRYQLEALVRTDGVVALDPPQDEGAPGTAAGIRASGDARGEGASGGGERVLKFEFEVTESTADVELVLELRAQRGTAMWRVDSVMLTKLRPQKSPRDP